MTLRIEWLLTKWAWRASGFGDTARSFGKCPRIGCTEPHSHCVGALFSVLTEFGHFLTFFIYRVRLNHDTRTSLIPAQSHRPNPELFKQRHVKRIIVHQFTGCFLWNYTVGVAGHMNLIEQLIDALCQYNRLLFFKSDSRKGARGFRL